MGKYKYTFGIEMGHIDIKGLVWKEYSAILPSSKNNLKNPFQSQENVQG